VELSGGAPPTGAAAAGLGETGAGAVVGGVAIFAIDNGRLMRLHFGWRVRVKLWTQGVE